jgi:hypothetical protein
VFSSSERKRDTTMPTGKNQQNLAVCAGFKRFAGIGRAEKPSCAFAHETTRDERHLPEAYSLPADNAKSIRPRLSGMQPDHR